MIIQYGNPLTNQPGSNGMIEGWLFHTAHPRIVPASLQEPMPGAQVEGHRKGQPECLVSCLLLYKVQVAFMVDSIILSIYIYTFIFIYLFMHVYEYKYICIYIYMHMYIYIHLYLFFIVACIYKYNIICIYSCIRWGYKPKHYCGGLCLSFCCSSLLPPKW